MLIRVDLLFYQDLIHMNIAIPRYYEETHPTCRFLYYYNHIFISDMILLAPLRELYFICTGQKIISAPLTNILGY